MATRPKLSIIDAEKLLIKHHHSEISKGFEKLEARRLIEKIKKIERSWEDIKNSSRGGQRKYYKINEKGLYILIQEARLPNTFWRALLAYCHRNVNGVSSDEIAEFCQRFMSENLKYLSRSVPTLQLDLFEELCESWFEQVIKNSKKITPDQKFLEVLARHPKITFEEIGRYTGKPVREDEIKGIMHRYTETPPKIKNIDDDNNVKILDNFDDQFHRFVVTRPNDNGTATYELSLFGVMIVLTLIREDDMAMLKPGLFYRRFSPEVYYDMVASNYSNNLPLIFGKREWRFLRKTLKGMAIYNFDILLSKEVRSECFAEPYLIKGKSEIYHSAMKITSYRRKQLEEFQHQASKQYDEYIKEITNNSPADAAQIHDRLRPVIRMDFSTSDQDKSRSPSDIDKQDEALAEEMTFVYYLNLRDDEYFPSYTWMDASTSSERYDVSTLPAPVQVLSQILKENEKIRTLFSRWMEDIAEYQRETLKSMKDLY
jgi:hypothetical protein